MRRGWISRGTGVQRWESWNNKGAASSTVCSKKSGLCLLVRITCGNSEFRYEAGQLLSLSCRHSAVVTQLSLYYAKMCVKEVKSYWIDDIRLSVHHFGSVNCWRFPFDSLMPLLHKDLKSNFMGYFKYGPSHRKWEQVRKKTHEVKNFYFYSNKNISILNATIIAD
jgi:hypothetical protein